jgi:Icc-related predicted phosphoesterase
MPNRTKASGRSGEPASRSLRLVCLSDTHGLHRQVRVPEGDVLIHAGDITDFFAPPGQSLEMLKDFNAWLGGLPHRHKLVVAGNHELVFQEEPKKARMLLSYARYLENSGIELEGIRFWGSPQTPVMASMGFALELGAAARRHWSRIPEDTDVLITHGPPYGILDQPVPWQRHQGDMELLLALRRLRFRLHVFGHNHGGYGQETNRASQCFLNCSLVDEHHRLANPPVVVDLTCGS